MTWLGLLVVLACALVGSGRLQEECEVPPPTRVKLQSVLSLAETPASHDLGFMRGVYLSARREGRYVRPDELDYGLDYGVGDPELKLEQRASALLNKLLAADVSAAAGRDATRDATRDTTRDATKTYSKVVVVGAGPVGLINAVQAALLGGNVSVFEKRSRFATRDVWFDVASPTVNTLSQNHDSLGFLLKLGMSEFLDLNETRHENVDGRGGSIWTLPLIGITRFLSTILEILGVTITYDHPITTIDPSPSVLTCIADGAISPLASSLSIPYVPPPSVVLEGNNFGVPSPHNTLIVTLAPTNTSCPELRNGRDGKVIDPYFPGFVLSHLGVTSIFKRFFHNHCSMQIFFDTEGARVSPESVVAEAFELLLVEPQAATTKITGMKSFSVLPRRLETVGAKNYIFVGDSAVSAHYRLGIGINHGILMAEKYAPVLTGEMSTGVYNERASRDYAAAEMSMAKFIKLESQCDFVLFQDEIFERSGEGNYVDVDPRTAFEHCVTKGS